MSGKFSRIGAYQSKILVCIDVPGFHYWEEPTKESVRFLSNLHRHIFKISAKIEVFDDDRELEFFLCASKLRQFVDEISEKFCNDRKFLIEQFKEHGVYFGGMSCEQIAKHLIDSIVSEYGPREVEVTVSEDGENAGIVKFVPMKQADK